MTKKLTVKEMNEMVFDSNTLNGGVIHTNDRYYKIWREEYDRVYYVQCIEDYSEYKTFKTKAQAMKYVRERYF